MQDWDAAMEDLTRLKETIDNSVSLFLFASPHNKDGGRYLLDVDVFNTSSCFPQIYFYDCAVQTLFQRLFSSFCMPGK